ncbi:MAG: ABC transporter ATP-binding protein [Candidatus Lokiarchaeota archaeon]|nr:ABC transporter ATP-binding protein [Candidatus Lokiarchaeota archaeon]
MIYAVEVEKINFNYNSGFQLSKLSLKVEKNSIYALIGNNGSGKTTLLRLLVGLIWPTSGSIKIFDQLLTKDKQKLWNIRKQVGFLFQNPDDQLFAPTVKEDIGFGARNLKLDEDEITIRVDWALKAVRLEDYKNYSPFDLSWGQKKRVALAGLLVMKPKLLILDEPFANLDFKSIYNHLEILENLRKLQDLTIMFTTHNLFFVEHWAEKMLFINDGQSVYEGNPIDGLNNPQVKNVLSSYEEILTLLKK